MFKKSGDVSSIRFLQFEKATTLEVLDRSVVSAL